MRLSSTAITAILAYTTFIEAAPAQFEASSELAVREIDHKELIARIEAFSEYKNKRDSITDELDKREYEIVTQVLSALNDTNLAPKIIHYFATNATFEPIVINAIVGLLKSGLLDFDSLLSALVDSGLINKVIDDVISDCTLYEKLFSLAASLIKNLASKVEDLIEEGVEKLTSKREDVALPAVVQFDERDTSDVVINLLQSLGNSGLASSVVKSILTDSSYIPFAVDLIKQVLANNALDIGEVISAVKESGLLGSLFRKIFSLSTLETVVTTAFAAFNGDCGGSLGTATTTGKATTTAKAITGGQATTTTTKGGFFATTTPTTVPCKKRRRRRREVLNY